MEFTLPKFSDGQSFGNLSFYQILQRLKHTLVEHIPSVDVPEETLFLCSQI